MDKAGFAPLISWLHWGRPGYGIPQGYKPSMVSEANPKALKLTLRLGFFSPIFLKENPSNGRVHVPHLPWNWILPSVLTAWLHVSQGINKVQMRGKLRWSQTTGLTVLNHSFSGRTGAWCFWALTLPVDALSEAAPQHPHHASSGCCLWVWLRCVWPIKKLQKPTKWQWFSYNL